MKGLPIDVRDFLKSYPRMTLRPVKSADLIFEGVFEFAAIDDQGKKISDEYEIRIEVPSNFPSQLPNVYEIGKRIPRSAENHVNPDGSLCLGSPLRLKILAARTPSLVGYASNCILPFLYAHSMGSFMFGELSHGVAGLIEDYKDMLNVPTEHQVIQCLTLSSLRRRVANKRKCPCGCGRRLGVCAFREKINNLRRSAPRSWFVAHGIYLESQV